MKLLRLTTRETNGLYDCSFNDQLVIPSNSKIALQSLSMDLDPLSLRLTGQNNGLFYQVASDYSKTVLLNAFDYNSANYKVLLTDIENKLNDSLEYDPAKTKKILGMEWIALINAQKHVSIGYKIGISSEFSVQDHNGFGWRNNDDNLERGPSSWSLKDGDPATPLLTNNLIMNGFISRGNGYVRCGIDRLATDSDGYYIGLVEDDAVINTGNMALSDMTYAIRVYTVGGVRTYATVIDGVETDSVQPVGFLGNGNANNDRQEIHIDGNTVKFNVYTQAGGETPVNLHGGRLDYTSGQTLFPFLIINGDKDSTRVNTLRLTLSPFNPSIAEYIETEYEPELGLPSPPNQPRNLLSKNLIEWGSYGVARFLGYTTQRQPTTGFLDTGTLGIEPIFNGERVFNIPSEADSYLIEMMNLSCDSYDSYSNTEFAQGGQRKNLLSVIPSTNESGKLVYFPPYPTFVDLLNREEIYLRNIKIRVSRTDYSEVSASGLGSMVLLIN
tara:strand:+ start:891 stop:2387 length:1497 start_codon:yes stop_codon:yes gene_type:complete